MSVLETPRVYFKGEITWDPIVTNNSPQAYAEGTATPVFAAVADKVKAFRDSAIGDGGNWNPHGTHRSIFYETRICGADLGDGAAADDSFVGAPCNFAGMLVDLEPYGGSSSQLFFDTMRFGIDGGCRILAPRTSRFTARYVNFDRNYANSMIAGIASVVWQASFAKADGLRIDAFGSPALQALAAALEAEDVLGLTVRFNTYRTVYYGDPSLSNGPSSRPAAAALVAKLRQGGFQPNPARSALVGVVGLWRDGEPAHEPGDRALVQIAQPPDAPNFTTRYLAAAQARLSETRLTLDLSNSVSEVDRALTKRQDLGDLLVSAVDPANGTATALGALAYGQYDREAYEASAGIATLPLTAAQAAAARSGDIEVRTADGLVLLAEQRFRAIAANPNLYMDEGETRTAEFQIYDRGAPATAALPVTVYQMSASGGRIAGSGQTTTDAAGKLAFPIQATAGAIWAYVVAPNPGEPAPAGGISTQTLTYMYVRALPADHNIAALPPTWANLYSTVLADWDAMAPCMDNWLPLSSPRDVARYAPLLRRLTDPANFEAFRFMPVTRDMSVGKRALLLAFLDHPQADADAEAPEAARPFVARSRALR